MTPGKGIRNTRRDSATEGHRVCLPSHLFVLISLLIFVPDGTDIAMMPPCPLIVQYVLSMLEIDPLVDLVIPIQHTNLP